MKKPSEALLVSFIVGSTKCRVDSSNCAGRVGVRLPVVLTDRKGGGGRRDQNDQKQEAECLFHVPIIRNNVGRTPIGVEPGGRFRCLLRCILRNLLRRNLVEKVIECSIL